MTRTGKGLQEMRRSILIPLLILPILVLGSLPAAAEIPLDLFGYYESELDVLFPREGGGKSFMQYHKLRFDMAAAPSPRAAFAANYNYRIYFGKTELSVADFLPASVAEEIPAHLRGFYQVAFPDENYLDNAYLRLEFPLFDVTLGKAPVSPGAGYAWNPTDVFNRKDVMDPTYEKTGQNVLSVEVPLGRLTHLNGLVSPGGEWDRFRWMVRMKSNRGQFDFSGCFATLLWAMTDYVQVPYSVPFLQRRRLFGADFAGELFGLGFWGECAWNEMGDPRSPGYGGGPIHVAGSLDDYVEGLLGVDYTFSSGLYLMGEYLHNGSGFPGKEEYHLGEFLQYYAGERTTIARNYLFTLVQYPLTDTMTGELFNIANLDDRSAAINPGLSWDMFEDVTVSATANLFLGGEDAEFSAMKASGYLRVRCYF